MATMNTEEETANKEEKKGNAMKHLAQFPNTIKLTKISTKYVFNFSPDLPKVYCTTLVIPNEESCCPRGWLKILLMPMRKARKSKGPKLK